MKHLTIVYALPDDIGIDAIPSSKYFADASWCDAIAQKSELLDAMIYIQNRVETGRDVALSRVNNAIRKATT